MHTLDEVTLGIIKWIRHELIPVLPSYAGWILGGMVIHHSGNLTDFVRNLGAIGQTLDIYNKDGMVDVDRWILDLKQSMKEFYDGKLVVTIAGLKPITFTESDLDSMKRYIKGEL